MCLFLHVYVHKEKYMFSSAYVFAERDFVSSSDVYVFVCMITCENRLVCSPPLIHRVCRSTKAELYNLMKATVGGNRAAALDFSVHNKLTIESSCWNINWQELLCCHLSYEQNNQER